MEERNEVMVMEEESTEVTNYSEVSESNGKGLGAALLVGAVTIVGGGIAAWKNRDKLKEAWREKQITKAEKKLRKYGCEVIRTSAEEAEVIKETLNSEDDFLDEEKKED